MKGHTGHTAISPIQLVLLVFGTVVGVGFITMPRGVMEKAREDAWLTVLLACLLALLSLWLIIRAARVYPERTMIEANVVVFGRVFGFLLNALLMAYFLLFTVTGLRTMAEVVRAEMLPFTPLEAIVIAMLLTLLYSSWGGLMPIIRINESGQPISFFLIVVFLMAALLEADWHELRLPLVEGVMPVIRPLASTTYSYLGFEILLVYYPYVANKQTAFRNAATGIGLAGGFYAFIVLGTILTISPDVTITQTYPVITMAKTIEVIRQFVERAELLLIIVWLPMAYTTHMITFFTTAFSLNRVFPRISFHWSIVLLLPTVYFLALVPDNLLEMEKWSNVVGNVGLFFLFVYPLLFLIMVKIRSLGGLLRVHGKEGERG